MLRFIPFIRVAALGVVLGTVPVPVLSAQASAASALATEAGKDGEAGRRFASVREAIRQLVEAESLPSIVVAVARDGEILWQEGFGWADVERRIPATPRTPYSIASISKPMTATAIMKLVEQGVLDLDRSVNDYLRAGRVTGVAGDAAGATVRRVLNHTAGLPLHYAFFYEGSGYPARSTDEGIARYGVLINPSGVAYEYSNLGYGILDRIIEHVTGRGYGEFMRSEVFVPLGMEQSSVGTGAGLRDAAVRYDARKRPIPFYGFDHHGGSAVYSSVLDLIRFGQAQLSRSGTDRPRLLSDANLRAMQQVTTPESTTQGYGLGWQVVEDDGGYRRVSHTGGMPGVTTALYIYPDENLVVAAVTNTRDRVVLQVAEKAAAAVLPGYGETLLAQRARGVGNNTQLASALPSKELLGEWRGYIHTYQGAVPLALVVQRNGEVRVTLGDQPRTRLDQVAFRGGYLVGHFAGLIPTEDAQRHPHTVRLDLRLRDGALAGQASAIAATEEIHFALSSYVELRKPRARRWP